jgi:hypothetical protein
MSKQSLKYTKPYSVYLVWTKYWPHSQVKYYVGPSCTKYWPLALWQVKDDYFRGCLTCTKNWPPSQIKDDYFRGCLTCTKNWPPSQVKD